MDDIFTLPSEQKWKKTCWGYILYPTETELLYPLASAMQSEELIA
jgi:hypothetical protein